MHMVSSFTAESARRTMRSRLGLAALVVCTGIVQTASVARAVDMLEEPPNYGSFYDRYEPSFYTGFAPRGVDPRRLHLHIGRGNQVRATVVLSDDVLRDYARDLQARQHTYRTLVDEGRIELTQNRGFEAFNARLAEIGLERLVREEGELAPETLRARNLALLERLNPGRVFRIEFSEDELMRRWLARLKPADTGSMGRDRRLELVNALLPTRLWLAELDTGTVKELKALVGQGIALTERGAQAEDVALADDTAGVHPTLLADDAAPTTGSTVSVTFRAAYFALLERVSHDLYPRRDGRLAFVEFTAIYPIGSVNEYTTYRGSRIPLYPTPGRRALTTHQRTKTVDHIPTVAVYSYSPWIPYMHVGTKLHNSFHTLWWRMQPKQTRFLPESWKNAPQASRDGKSYQYLWLISRGPMSHGCTHLTTGHIAELRQLFPSETEKLYDIDTFLNKSYLYDVFDIDGDFTPEVMGVRYFIAYSLKNKKPDVLRVRNERRAYYEWLYGGELRLDEEGRGSFGEMRDGRFVERTAKDGATYEGLALYEAAYEPEKFQMYKLVDIPFARALRKVGLHHPFKGVPPPLTSAAGGKI